MLFGASVSYRCEKLDQSISYILNIQMNNVSGRPSHVLL